ncbi:MAG: Na+/H+ antiporter [Planctomycetota bacterium]
MSVIELVLVLLAVTAGLEVIASAFRLPVPALLVAAGLAVALIPGVPRPELDPEAVFLVFIPPLLYWTALTASFRDFRQQFVSISLLAVGLVLATTAVVAVVAHALIPELPWAAAFVLGAIVSPPDPVAVVAVTRHLSIPKSIITVLEGEGLVNDATALVAYRMSVAAVFTGAFSIKEASLKFLVAGLGGVAVGLAVGIVIAWVRQRVGKAPTVEATISLLTPFLAFIPAERIHIGETHASGVLAVVAVGLYLGRLGPRIVSAQSRLQSTYMWRMITFLLEGLVFLLVGLELPKAFEHLEGYTVSKLVLYATLVSLAAIGVRLAWVFPGAYVERILRAPFDGWKPVPRWQETFFTGWAGIRGGDSLVIALSLPLVTASGAPFPGRPLIIFLTFVVIVVTLVVLGLTLSPVVRRLGLRGDDAEEREEAEARQRLFVAARGPLDVSRSGVQQFVRTALDVVTAQRTELVTLRDRGVINDDVLRKLQHELDLQEVLLESRPTAPPRIKS